MLTGIDPLLTGQLLKILDEMGHSDHIAIVDANFPAHRVGALVIEAPGIHIVPMVKAIRQVMALDDAYSPVLMDSGQATLPHVQRDILEACGDTPYRLIDRWEYYALTQGASAVVATGELRLWANVTLYKGIAYQTH